MLRYAFAVGMVTNALLTASPPPLTTLAQQQEEPLQQIRDHLHSIPELRWQEEETLAYIRSLLQAIAPCHGRQLIIHSHYSGGLVADLLVDGATDTIMLRADVDALPIAEEDGHQPRSHRDGVMHACGHDIHSAMLLVACRLLATDDRLSPTSNLRMVWQRAEENPGSAPQPLSGAERLIDEGVLDEVSKVYGLHIWAKTASGLFEARPGPFFANSARLHVIVETSGGHVAQPHRGVNALRVATAIQQLLADFAIRTSGPLVPLSLEPALLHSGTASNVMPARADIWYSFRNFFNAKERQQFVNRLRYELNLLGQRYDAKVSLQIIDGHPMTCNDAAEVERVTALLRSQGQQVAVALPNLAGEDFACYLRRRPGCFWLLGADRPTGGDHHTPSFDPDRQAFWRGVLYWLLLATA